MDKNLFSEVGNLIDGTSAASDLANSVVHKIQLVDFKINLFGESRIIDSKINFIKNTKKEEEWHIGFWFFFGPRDSLDPLNLIEGKIGGLYHYYWEGLYSTITRQGKRISKIPSVFFVSLGEKEGEGVGSVIKFYTPSGKEYIGSLIFNKGGFWKNCGESSFVLDDKGKGVWENNKYPLSPFFTSAFELISDKFPKG